MGCQDLYTHPERDGLPVADPLLTDLSCFP